MDPEIARQARAAQKQASARDKQRADARATLAACDVPINAEFHALSSWQVELLIVAADSEKYRLPKDANGSRARYYHERLQRRAR